MPSDSTSLLSKQYVSHHLEVTSKVRTKSSISLQRYIVAVRECAPNRKEKIATLSLTPSLCILRTGATCGCEHGVMGYLPNSTNSSQIYRTPRYMLVRLLSWAVISVRRHRNMSLGYITSFSWFSCKSPWGQPMRLSDVRSDRRTHLSAPAIRWTRNLPVQLLYVLPHSDQDWDATLTKAI